MSNTLDDYLRSIGEDSTNFFRYDVFTDSTGSIRRFNICVHAEGMHDFSQTTLSYGELDLRGSNSLFFPNSRSSYFSQAMTLRFSEEISHAPRRYGSSHNKKLVGQDL